MESRNFIHRPDATKAIAAPKSVRGENGVEAVGKTGEASALGCLSNISLRRKRVDVLASRPFDRMRQWLREGTDQTVGIWTARLMDWKLTLRNRLSSACSFYHLCVLTGLALILPPTVDAERV